MTQTDETASPGAPAGGAPETLPCHWCGRPVPQTPGAGRKRSYCTDRDCQDQAKRARAARRAAGGIGGDVAATEELIDRLDAFVGRLADGLATELTPAGVQSALSRGAATAAAEIAAARAEMDTIQRTAAEEVARSAAARDAAAADAGQARAAAAAADTGRDAARGDAEAARAAEQAAAGRADAA